MTEPAQTERAGRVGRFRDALGESPPLLWSFLYFFCLLSGYYVLRPVREAMGASNDVATVFPPALIEFFTARGIALKDLTLQVLFTCTFLIMLLLQPVYGWLVSRWPRRVFLPAVYGFFIATLLLFYAMFDSGVPGRGMAFFLWITVFNLFAVAVFWSFMADVYDNAEARRYYGYIGAAGTVGAFLGPILTRTLVERAGIANLMLIAAALHDRVLYPRFSSVVESRRRSKEGLTGRERQCLGMAANGLTSSDIGGKLGIAERTVNFHMRNVMRKLDALNRSEAIAKALTRGVIHAGGATHRSS